MTASYITPGSPPPPPPPQQPNAYRTPVGSLQDNGRPPPPPQATEVEPPPVRDQDDPHRALLAEWRRRHGDSWIRADELAPAVRRMIDARERLPAIRQKLRQLVNTHPELETKVVGNRAKPVAHYRLVGLEG